MRLALKRSGISARRGGVSGMDARRFAGGRAEVSRDALNASRGESFAHLRGERDGGRDRDRDAPRRLSFEMKT